jgi:tetratricopeptide (TPR) repeat protein
MPSRFGLMLVMLALISIGAGCSSLSKRQASSSGTNQLDKSLWAPAANPPQLEERAEAHARFLAGLSLDQNQLPEEALAEYEKALAADPDNEDLAAELSRRYVQRKDYDKAIAVLKKAAAAPGSSGLVLARLSFIYLQQGKTNDAIQASR